MNKVTSYDVLMELLSKVSKEDVIKKLYIHKGTFNRWLQQKKVPDNYFNDINHLLGDKYKNKESARDKDQFFTTDKIASYCYKKSLDILKKLDINIENYWFIEPSAGECGFYYLLPEHKRIGIDIEPKGLLGNELIKMNYLDFFPDKKNKYIVIGNPPFGLRGNLALRFINHSYDFADAVCFILPKLFNSTGKGVPMKRVKGYKLAYSEELPLDSFIYPNGKKVEVATLFQVWVKVNTDKIKIEPKKTCDSYIKIYSLSDGGTPSSTRNKNMLDKCDVYLPSTCYTGMKVYDSFEKLPNRRGYGIVILKDKSKILSAFKNIDWKKVSFLSTNSAVNLRTDIIQNEIVKMGFVDV